MRSMAFTQTVAWRSPLGIAIILFLLYGALNILFAIVVPLMLHTQGVGAAPGLILSADADGSLLGRSLGDIARSEPRLNAYLVSFMDTM
ncbi:MAG TPA: hypothetical protein VGK54_11395 [Chloroflexota bacterium]